MADVKEPVDATKDAPPAAPPPSPVAEQPPKAEMSSAQIADALKNGCSDDELLRMSQEALVSLTKKAVDSSSMLVQKNEELEKQLEHFNAEKKKEIIQELEKYRDESLQEMIDQAKLEGKEVKDLDSDPEIAKMRDFYNKKIGLVQRCSVEEGRQKLEDERPIMVCSLDGLREKRRAREETLRAQKRMKTEEDNAQTTQRMGKLFAAATGGVSTSEKIAAYQPSQPNVRFGTATPPSSNTESPSSSSSQSFQLLSKTFDTINGQIMANMAEFRRSGTTRAYDGKPLTNFGALNHY